MVPRSNIFPNIYLLNAVWKAHKSSKWNVYIRVSVNALHFRKSLHCFGLDILVFKVFTHIAENLGLTLPTDKLSVLAALTAFRSLI